jgi:GTPase SAR1 family protein
MIIGNKCDLDAERTVEQSLATSKITELGLTYMELSAKTGHNIKEFFRELAAVIGGGKKGKD